MLLKQSRQGRAAPSGVDDEIAADHFAAIGDNPGYDPAFTTAHHDVASANSSPNCDGWLCLDGLANDGLEDGATRA